MFHISIHNIMLEFYFTVERRGTSDTIIDNVIIKLCKAGIINK